MNFLQKLLGREKAPDPLPNNMIQSVDLPAPSPRLTLPPGLHIGQKTDVGRQRERNEDSLYTLNSFIHSNGLIRPFGIFIVADGMGGYKGGEKASSLAAKIAADHIVKNLYLPDLLPAVYSDIQATIIEVLTTAVTEANQAILTQVPESGTTLTIAVVMGQQAYLAHVGDSRAYLYHDNELEQLTQDHSVVARMVEVGQLTAEEALTHQNRNVLYRAIGQTNTLEVETYLHTFLPNSYLLLCSDGLWNLISDEEICQVLKASESLDTTVSYLVDLANKNGGDDNITVILVGQGE